MGSLRQTAFTNGRSIPAKYHGFGAGSDYSGIPYRSSAIQDLSGGTKTGTDATVNDRLSLLTNPRYVENACATFSGGQVITTTAECPYLTPLTFSVLFRSSTTGQTAYLLHQGGNNGINSLASMAALFASGILVIKWGGQSSLAIGTQNQYIDGAWHHLLLSVSGSVVSAFVDGIPRGSISNITTVPSDTNYPLCFGARHADDPTTFNTYFIGQMCDFRHSTCTQLPMQDGWGTTCFNVNPTAGSNSTVVGATLATFWGSTQDAIAGNIKNGFTLCRHDTDTVTNPDIYMPYLTTGIPNTAAAPTGYSKVGNYPPNSATLPPCESKILQTDFGIVNRIVVIEDGEEHISTFADVAFGYPGWGGDYGITWSGEGFWEVVTPTGVYISAASISRFPPKTGYTLVSGTGGEITLVYNEFWVEDGEFIARGYDEVAAHYNTENGNDGVWIRTNNQTIPAFTEITTYDYLFWLYTLPAILNRLEHYFGGESGAVLDELDAVITDEDGYVIWE